jgi:hypothetical protein
MAKKKPGRERRPARRRRPLIRPAHIPMQSKLSPVAGFLLSALLYCGVTAVFFHYNLPTLTTELIGPPEDNMQDLWNTWYSQQLSSLRVADWFFTNRIFYPEGTSLLYHSFAYSDLAIMRLVRFLFGLPLTIPVLIALNNITLLASFIFAGLAMYIVTYHFTRNFAAAWLGGFIFAFSPFHFAHSLHHMHVATIQFIPLFVFCVLRLEETKKSVYGIGGVIFCLLSALSSWYFLAYNFLFMLFHYLYRALQNKKFFIRPLLLQYSAVAGFTLLFLSPLILAMLKAGSHNPGVYESGHDITVADLAALFVPHPYHLAARWFVGFHDRFTGNPWEMSVYLGIFNVILIVWAMLRIQYRSQDFFRWTICGMVWFTLIAGGRYLHILGISMKPFILPTAIFEYVPVLANLRTPSRAIVYAYFFLGLFVAWFFASLLRADNREAQLRWWPRVPIAIVIFLGIIVDYLSFNRESTSVICPPAYSVLANTPASAGILNLPMSYEVGNRFMMYQLCLDRPIVYASISRKLNTTLSDRLYSLNMAETKETLKRAGVRYIVVHRPLLTPTQSLGLSTFAKNFRLLFQDQTEVVFSAE